jgi:mono/diheme cytochrome c family protein
MKTKFIIAAIAIVAIPFSKSYGQGGEQIFKTNCGACHTVGKGKLVGPDLKGVQDRHSEEWILKWVHSSQALVKSGDKDAVKLFNDNNQIQMPDQALSDAEVKTVLDYIKTGGAPAVAAAPAGDASKSATVQSSGTDNITAATQKVADDEKAGPSLLASFGFTNYLVLFLIGILLIVIWVLAMSVKGLSEELKTKLKN